MSVKKAHDPSSYGSLPRAVGGSQGQRKPSLKGLPAKGARGTVPPGAPGMSPDYPTGKDAGKPLQGRTYPNYPCPVPPARDVNGQQSIKTGPAPTGKRAPIDVGSKPSKPKSMLRGRN